MPPCTGTEALYRPRGSRGIALPSIYHGTIRCEGKASRPGRSLPPGKTRYPLYRRLGGTQGPSGQVRKISPPPGFDLRTVQPVASRYTEYATRLTVLLVACSIQLSPFYFCRHTGSGHVSFSCELHLHVFQLVRMGLRQMGYL